MDKTFFKNLQKKYSGMYVLMDKPDGKVIAASRNLKKAFKEAEKRIQTPSYSIHRTLWYYSYLIFSLMPKTTGQPLKKFKAPFQYFFQ